MIGEMRTRCSPWGPVIHDVFAPEDSPWRASAEFWLYPLPGDYYFSDLGDEDDWLGFCGEFAKQPEDDFEIIEKALLFYAQTPAEDGYNPPGPNRKLAFDDGQRARAGLKALDRLVQDWAERNANAVRDARDAMRTGWD